MKHYTAHDEHAMSKVACDFASTLKGGEIILLEGTLGAGKTVFARALIRALSGDEDMTVPSPTFTLLQNYTYNHGEIWHFDLYRLKDADEIYELGWEDFGAKDIALIEWPARLEHLTPDNAITVKIEIDNDARLIHISD